MTWMQRGVDERLVKAMEIRREIQRGPLPRGGSPYADDPLTAARIAAHAFGASTLFLVILVVLMAGATAYYSAYSGALRWLLIAGLVGILGLLAVRVVGAIARDPARLGSTRAEAAPIGGDLKALRATLLRADSGLAYSQLVFEDRMRRAFMEKVRVERSLPPGAIEASLRDPERLHAIIGDRELTLFVLECARNMRLYPASLPHLPKRSEFARRAAVVLARMEAWR